MKNALASSVNEAYAVLEELSAVKVNCCMVSRRMEWRCLPAWLADLVTPRFYGHGISKLG